MATLAPITPPARQPFGVLTDSKLRQLQSVKNRQNALNVSSAPSLKRRAPSPDLSDSENVNPNLLDSVLNNKRKKAAFDSDVSYSKPSQYSLDVVYKPCAPQPSSTPRLGSLKTSSNTPASAPPAATSTVVAAAGRSPTKPNRRGILPPKRKLVAPPSCGIKPPALSISAALNGTLAGKKRSSKTRTHGTTTSSAPTTTNKPKSWFFDIFEEPEQVQNDRMNVWTLSESASFLDVSDDERKGKKEKVDSNKENKENIDPNDQLSSGSTGVAAPVTRSMAAAMAASQELKKDIIMTTTTSTADDRFPLGDLNPADYYAPGLDATSVVLVHDEAGTSATAGNEDIEEDNAQAPNAHPSDFTFTAPSEHLYDDITAGAGAGADDEDIDSILAASAPADVAVAAAPTTIRGFSLALPLEEQTNAEGVGADNANDNAEIEIWESQSAKDENEKRELDSINGDNNPFVF